MASVLAIVAKAVFEEDARVGGRLSGEGDVWATAQYVSGNKGLAALSEGGSLFLVTVRPPDERLWLVGALVGPTFDGKRWTAPANVAPITDITAWIGALRFSTGKGVAAKPGKLGMALQTPRRLTEADVALLEAALRGEAPVVMALAEPGESVAERVVAVASTDPADPVEAARGRALAALEAKTANELDALAARARSASARAAKGFKGAAKALGNAPEAVAVLDWGAELLCPISRKSAGGLFKSARALERRLKLSVDQAARMAAYRRMAEARALERSTLVGLVKDLTAARAAGMVEPLVALIDAWVAGAGDFMAGKHPDHELINGGVGILSEELLGGLDKLGKAVKSPRLAERVLVGQLGKLRRAEPAVWELHRAAVVEALSKDASLARWAASLFPPDQPMAPWRRVLTDSGCVAVAVDSPEAAKAWVLACARWGAGFYTWSGWGDWFDATLNPVQPHLAGLRVPGSKLGRDRSAFVDAVDVLLSRGVKVDPGASPDLTVHGWANTAGRRPLVHIAADPVWREVLYDVVERALLQRRGGAPTAMLHAAAEAEGVRPVFDRLAARVDRIATEGTLATLASELEGLDKVLTPAVLAASPALRDAVQRLDVAAALARTFRLGILDEWSWPAQDAANDSLPTDVYQYETDGPFPHFVMNHDGGTMVVLGPEGEVWRGQRPADLPVTSRSLRYIDGDILYYAFKGPLRLATWLSQLDAPFDTELYETWTVGVPTPEGGVWEGRRTLYAGSRDIRRFSQSGVAFSDGARCWVGRVEVDPDTGAVLAQGLPAWLAEVEVDGATLLLEHSYYYPVPPSLRSPLGQRDGQAGFRVWKTASGALMAETIDGRRWTGGPEETAPKGLMRFPGRDGDYAVTYPDHNLSIWAPGGADPIVPPVHAALYNFWRGAGQWLSMPWWHYLVPRDPEGSRALIACTVAQAQALLDAARSETPPEAEAEALGDETLKVTMQRAPDGRVSPLTEHPQTTEACEAAFPTVTARRLRAGMVHLATHAARLGESVARWQASVAAPLASVHGGMLDRDAKVIGELFGPGWGYGPTDFEGAVRDAEAWLTGPVTEGETVGPVAASQLRWEQLFLFLGGAVRRLLAPGTPEPARVQLRRVLTLWRGTAFAQHRERFRLLRCVFSKPPTGMQLHTSDLGVQWGHRYLLRTRAWQGDRFEFAMLEYDAAGAFVDPPGAEVLESYAGATLPVGASDLDAAFAARDAQGPSPTPPELVARIVAETGMLPATAALLWAGAARPWEADTALRKALGITRADVELALTEVPRFVEPLYARSLPADPASLYAPLADDGTGQSPASRFIAEWIDAIGVRTPLDVATVRQLEADLHTRKEQFHFDVRVFERPDAHAFLTRDATWVVRPWRGFQSSVSYMRGFIPEGWPKHTSQEGDRSGHPNVEVAFSGWVLRRFLRFVPWAHLELPVGHPHRVNLALLCLRIAERLRNPDLLLLAGAVDLSEQTEPVQFAVDFDEVQRRFEGAPYLAPDGGEAAAGLDRGDLVVTWPQDVENAFFVAVRPARLSDPAAVARMAADLGFYDVFRRTGGGCSCGLNFGNHKVVDFTELPSWLVWAADGFQRMVARLDDPALPDGAFEADPRTSAPSTVEAVQRALGLAEPAATAFLQHLTLPEPTPERLRRYNGWTTVAFDAAVAPLVERGLLVAGAHDATRRRLFVPGKMAFPAQPAIPLEASKLPLYGLEPDRWDRLTPTFGVVMPLRPLGELFEAAWAGWEAHGPG